MQINKILGNVGVLYVGSYNPSKQYEYLNCVTYNGSSYVCVNQNGVIGVTPGTTSDWQLSAKKGDVGPVGPKPVNGVDYNTDEEKEEFKNEVVSTATIEVEQNISNIQEQAIQEFNSNASTKTNEYNSNTTTKLSEYNTNANTQVESFNANATSKTNDFNSNASTKTEEFNAVVDAEKEQFSGQTEAINHHIAVVSDELERVKNDVLETGEESGSYITLNDSAMAEYQELSVDGVCEQDTTKMTYKCTGEESGDYYFTYNDINYQFTMPTITSSSILVFDKSTLKLTLNNTEITTSTGTAGTLLTFLNTPNPNYPQPISVIENSLKITSCNKNLCNTNDIVFPDNWTIGNKNGSEVLVVDANGNFDWIGWNNYINSLIDKYGVISYGIFCDTRTNSEIIFNWSDSIGKSIYFNTIYTTREGKKERALVRNDFSLSNEILKIMISVENSSSYEQHLETQITANLPEGEFIGKINDTYKDTLEVEYNEEDGQYHLVLNKKINKIVLDGINNKFTYMDQSSHPNCLMISKNSRPIGIKNTDSVISTHFKITSGIPKTPAIGWDASTQMWINNDGFTTLETGNDWLSQNNVEVVYTLETPYVLDLGVVDQLISYDKVSNVFTNSDLLPQINLKYYRNFESTVRNLQINNGTLQNELSDLQRRVSALETAQTSIQTIEENV